FPVVAMAFCGGLFLPRTLGWILPPAVIVLSDLALSFYLGYPLLDSGQLVAWACLLITLGIGQWIADRKQLKVSVLFVILTGNALIFYLATNTIAWVSMPAYSRDAWGLIQALTTGLPGNPPTWVFFRNSLISDYVFFGMILFVFQIVCRSSPRPVTA
ncbi:MAG TPA: DUF6580 family putative transport protein, partial [Terrimicrobiaceae bacterium]